MGQYKKIMNEEVYMKINMFEGARRITVLLQASFVLFFVGLAVFETPYVVLTYETKHPNEPFSYAENQECDYLNDESEYIERKMDGHEERNIRLCFRAMQFSDGEMLIPFKIDEGGKIWGGSKYSDEVKAYVKKKKFSFFLPSDVDQKYRKVWWDKRLSGLWDGVKILVAGYLSLLIFSFVVGWIVRGFMGIPMGKDFKISETVNNN
ncbi:MAG: hypothetical protein EOM37_03980 [Proteobacteria bacterium]|nr:hypothetical protein [Alphaproteobacteria bacterium]NCC03194.1 hypothetical protein [Pseudomonadota bacterium]